MDFQPENYIPLHSRDNQNSPNERFFFIFSVAILTNALKNLYPAEYRISLKDLRKRKIPRYQVTILVYRVFGIINRIAGKITCSTMSVEKWEIIADSNPFFQ